MDALTQIFTRVHPTIMDYFLCFIYVLMLILKKTIYAIVWPTTSMRTFAFSFPLTVPRQIKVDSGHQFDFHPEYIGICVRPLRY